MTIVVGLLAVAVFLGLTVLRLAIGSLHTDLAARLDAIEERLAALEPDDPDDPDEDDDEPSDRVVVAFGRRAA